MKKIFKHLILLLSISFSLFGALDPSKVDDLEKFTMDLFDQLSDDEKKQVMDEALKLEEYIKSLPEEEQRALEEELESEVQTLMDSGTLQNIPKEELITPPVQEKEQTEIKEEKTLKFAQDIPGLKKQLKEISKIISDISLKLEEPGLLKSDTEEKWKSIQDPLMEAQSYILVISNNDKFMDTLLSSEYKILKSQLDSFYKEVKQKNSEFKSTTVSPLLNTLESHTENDQLLWGLKRFMQKFAPQEVKPDTKKAPPQEPTIITPPHYPSYPDGPVYPRYKDTDDIFNKRDGDYIPPYVPSRPDGPKRPPITKPDQPKFDSGGGGDKPRTDKDSKRDGDKKKEDGKDADKGKKEDDKNRPKKVSLVKKEKEDLEKHMKKITDTIEKNSLLKKFESLEESLLKEPEKKEPTRRSPDEEISLEDEESAETKTGEINENIGNIAAELIRIDELLKDPIKVSEEVDEKLKKAPKQITDKERSELLKLTKDRKFKFKELGEYLEKFSSEETGKKLSQANKTIQQRFEPVYKQFIALQKNYKDIIDHLKGEYKKTIEKPVAKSEAPQVSPT